MLEGYFLKNLCPNVSPEGTPFSNHPDIRLGSDPHSTPHYLRDLALLISQMVIILMSGRYTMTKGDTCVKYLQK